MAGKNLIFSTKGILWSILVTQELKITISYTNFKMINYKYAML